MFAPHGYFRPGQVVHVDADKLLDTNWGESYNVTVREVYGQWQAGGPIMLSVVDDCYGREFDVSADKLKEATLPS